jgi:type IV pilus assembly protein PilY1
MKTTIAIVLSGALLVLALSPAQADDTDIFGANVQPNVLILFDSSGSMFETIISNPYAPATTYSMVNKCGRNRNEPCNTPVVYQRTGTSRYEFYRSTVAGVSSSSARDALVTTGYWSGRISGSTVNLFAGNYLNYQLGFCPGAPCVERKIDIAKRTVKTLIDNTVGVRFGVMKFGNNSELGQGGGQMVAQIGTDAVTMKDAIDAIPPSGYTPLGEQMFDAGQYFKGLPLINGMQFESPIQLECQPNFIILVTDGKQNGSTADSTQPPPGNVQTEAGRRFTQDHAAGFTGLQNVIVHTVGFAITDADERDVANADLQTAATNGGGSFYYSNNAQELEAALQDAIRKVLAATFTFAAPVLPSTSTTGSTKAYLAAFQSDTTRPFWRGFLKAYQRDANGQVPVDPVTGVPLASALVWEAGQQLKVRAASTRTIFTVTGGTVTGGTMTGAIRQDFTTGNAAITAALLNVAAAERDKVIDFTRGIDAYDTAPADGNTTAERDWKLGDIFHSTPVLVTPPSLALIDASYRAFKEAQKNRTTVLIAGANDGMLHAFRESDGEELWAFIPPDVLDGLSALTVRSAEHPYFVDSSPIAADIKIGGAWKTIVVFGLRRGGRHYYALDITNITAPSFLWSFTDPKMGETWSEPAIGKVKVGASEKFVAFVGGGYDTGTNNATGKALFIIDLATGQKLWEYANDGAAADRQYLNFSLAANGVAVDLTNDGLIDRVYIGDVGGQLWKFDVSAPATAEWTGKRLVATDPGQANPPAAGAYYPAQAVYGAPSLALDEQGALWVFFGSGDRNHPNNTSANRFYGIKDTLTMANGDALDETDLVDVTSANPVATQGWFFRLPSNEKVLAASNVFNKVVFFSTFTPTSVVACGSGGGAAKLYAIQMDTGFGAVDFNTGDAFATSDSSRARSVTIGSGIASMPVIVITYPASGDAVATVSTSVVTATTSQELPSKKVPAPAALKRLLYWREMPRA